MSRASATMSIPRVLPGAGSWWRRTACRMRTSRTSPLDRPGSRPVWPERTTLAQTGSARTSMAGSAGFAAPGFGSASGPGPAAASPTAGPATMAGPAGFAGAGGAAVAGAAEGAGCSKTTSSRSLAVMVRREGLRAAVGRDRRAARGRTLRRDHVDVSPGRHPLGLEGFGRRGGRPVDGGPSARGPACGLGFSARTIESRAVEGELGGVVDPGRAGQGDDPPGPARPGRGSASGAGPSTRRTARPACRARGASPSGRGPRAMTVERTVGRALLVDRRVRRPEGGHRPDRAAVGALAVVLELLQPQRLAGVGAEVGLIGPLRGELLVDQLVAPGLDPLAPRTGARRRGRRPGPRAGPARSGGRRPGRRHRRRRPSLVGGGAAAGAAAVGAAGRSAGNRMALR
jgi:hypothetical protein